MSCNYQMALASSSSSSPSACLATHSHNNQHHQWKHDVFLNFRGEDTRDNFISHLLAALSEKGVETFIDYQLRKGDEIDPALRQAIRESNVAVVVFSQDYASSSWCLDELVEIMECRETRGQIVIPVFYRVDPSDVMEQTGSFAEASDRKRKRNFEINQDKVPSWKAALTRAANLAGWDSNVIRTERELIDQIVKDVLEKLNQALSLPTGLERLVGINSHLEQIKSVLAIGSQDVRILGIWGMGGIGKTTVAEATFSQISRQFGGCCFLKNVREESEKRGLTKLLEELISQALGDSHIKIYTSSIRPALSLTRRLYRKQILVVLDDVDDPQQLESLVGDPCWFGPGSRIIVTSRNKQAFASRADYIYEVKPLDDDAALQLFSQHAFKQNHPLEDRKPLSDLVVGYCQGNPLALKVLGSFLFCKNKTEWESAVNKLKRVPMSKIQKVLEISFKGLDREEREIFLHIACFFKGENRDTVIQVLDSCSFSTEIGIRVLIDKSLITTSTTRWDPIIALEMHDLLQEMGRELVREESKEPGEHSRLWDSEIIYQVFQNNTGTRKVEGIFLNMSKLRKEIHLNPKAFENMSNLKFLKIYNLKDVEGLKAECKVHLSHGLDYLPNALRYLYWYGYPLDYLPADFRPENPLLIELPHSNIKGLWNEAEPESVVKHFSSLRQFSVVTCISLVNCENLTSLPNNVDMRCLDSLDLSGCSRLKMFPEVSRNIRYLYLRQTAIKEVPSSVQYLDRLVELNLSHCTELARVTTNICKLTRLNFLDLAHCSKLKLFPEIFESMGNLERLHLGWTAIEELPSSVENLKGLKSLNMEGFTSLPSLTSWLGMSCLILSGLTSLSLKDSNLWQLPADLGCLSSLIHLDSSGNNFESIPESIKQLTQLQYLRTDNCRRLQSLPELPVSIVYLDASGCTSLENVSSLNQLLFDMPSILRIVHLSNCFKVNKNETDPISQFRNRYLAKHVKGNRDGKGRPFAFISYPGGRIPGWCVNQGTGNSIRIPLPSNWLNDRFLGFIICLVVECESNPNIHLLCNCQFGYDCDEDSEFAFALDEIPILWGANFESHTEHVVLLYTCSLYDLIDKNRPRLTQSSYDAVLFNFKPFERSGSHQLDCKVKKCGAIGLYAQGDDDEYNSA